MGTENLYGRKSATQDLCGEKRDSMTRNEYRHLLGEKTELARMIDETPEESVIDRLSLNNRLRKIEKLLAQMQPNEREPARAYLCGERLERENG